MCHTTRVLISALPSTDKCNSRCRRHDTHLSPLLVSHKLRNKKAQKMLLRLRDTRAVGRRRSAVGYYTFFIAYWSGLFEHNSGSHQGRVPRAHFHFLLHYIICSQSTNITDGQRGGRTDVILVAKARHTILYNSISL